MCVWYNVYINSHDYVFEVVSDQGVRFVRLWFVDVIGRIKSVAIDSSDLAEAFSDGVVFDGSAIEGHSRILESDMLLMPDASTFQSLPWRGDVHGAARMFADIHEVDGTVASIDSRAVLKRAMQNAANVGYELYAAPEIEFYLLKSLEGDFKLQPADDGGYFDHVPSNVGQDFRRKVITTLEEMGVSVQMSHHEAGRGQNEIKLRASDILTCADDIITTRTVIKEVALEFGLQASFLPKPFATLPGSAMHTHFTLLQGDKNLFHNDQDVHNLSDTAYSFMAGILKLSGEISLLTNQFVNSYKRITSSGFEAPRYSAWGVNNSSAMIRVPNFSKPNVPDARFELRSIDTAVNPYLCFAAVLSSGLYGVNNELEIQGESTENLYNLEDTQLSELPTSLDVAIRNFEQSTLMKEILGNTIFERLLIEKMHEYREYSMQITEYELKNAFNTV